MDSPYDRLIEAGVMLSKLGIYTMISVHLQGMDPEERDEFWASIVGSAHLDLTETQCWIGKRDSSGDMVDVANLVVSECHISVYRGREATPEERERHAGHGEHSPGAVHE